MSLMLEAGITASAATNVQHLLFLTTCHHFRMYTVVLCITARIWLGICISARWNSPSNDGSILALSYFPELHLLCRSLNSNKCCGDNLYNFGFFFFLTANHQNLQTLITWLQHTFEILFAANCLKWSAETLLLFKKDWVDLQMLSDFQYLLWHKVLWILFTFMF